MATASKTIEVEGKDTATKTTKCFGCGKDAVVIGNTCSPTSSSGVTDPRPFCGDCFGAIRGARNRIVYLVPEEEAEEKIRLGIAKNAWWLHFWYEGKHKLNGGEKNGCLDYMEITDKSVKCKKCDAEFER